MSDALVNKQRIGTFCVVVQKQLVVATCPLPQGACVWKHRQHGQCMADPARADLKVSELANLVGAPVPDDVEASNIRAALFDAIKENLK